MPSDLLYSAHWSDTSCIKADAGCHSGSSYPLYLTYHSKFFFLVFLSVRDRRFKIFST